MDCISIKPLRPYLILVDGRLAKRRKTYAFAMKDKRELETEGYNMVSIAYDTGNHS